MTCDPGQGANLRATKGHNSTSGSSRCTGRRIHVLPGAPRPSEKFCTPISKRMGKALLSLQQNVSARNLGTPRSLRTLRQGRRILHTHTRQTPERERAINLAQQRLVSLGRQEQSTAHR